MIEQYQKLVREHFKKELMINDDAHGLEHCDAVLRKMYRVKKHFNLVVNEKLMIMAAYIHDLKCHESREHHHTLSAEWVKNNADKDFFLMDLSTKEIVELYTAISEHRSRLNCGLTNTLSVVLNTADKDEPRLDLILYRSLQYNNDPLRVYEHIIDKYSRKGYIKYTKWYIDFYGKESLEKLYSDIDKLTIEDVIKFKEEHNM